MVEFVLVLDDNSFFPPSSTSTPEVDRSFPLRLLLLLPILKTVFHFDESVPLELLDGGVGRGGESDDLYAESDEGEAGRDADASVVMVVYVVGDDSGRAEPYIEVVYGVCRVFSYVMCKVCGGVS